MEKTTINNERKFLDRCDSFLDLADKLNYRTHYLYGNSINRFKINYKLYCVLCQIYDMYYSRMDDSDREKFKRIKKLVTKYHSEVQILRKGKVEVNEKYYEVIKLFYRFINSTIEQITTTRSVKKDGGNICW